MAAETSDDARALLLLATRAMSREVGADMAAHSSYQWIDDGYQVRCSGRRFRWSEADGLEAVT